MAPACSSQSRAGACLPVRAPVSAACSQCSSICNPLSIMSLANPCFSSSAWRLAMAESVAIETLCSVAIWRYDFPAASASRMARFRNVCSVSVFCCTWVVVAMAPAVAVSGAGGGAAVVKVCGGEGVCADWGGEWGEGDPSAASCGGEEDGAPTDGTDVGTEGVWPDVDDNGISPMVGSRTTWVASWRGPASTLARIFVCVNRKSLWALGAWGGGPWTKGDHELEVEGVQGAGIGAGAGGTAIQEE